ncbi:MAG: DUF342 domain-containing protein [Burkholderiales bacterium]|nr:DUF342 domain-containing protein [Burkholderiales bacterium]
MQNQYEIPVFIRDGDSGLAVDLEKMESPAEFFRFAGGVFDAGLLFTGIDYAAFADLLSLSDEGLQTRISDLAAKGKKAGIRFAAGIAPFAPERAALYRAPRFVSGSAQYLFEVVTIEKTIEEPLFEEGADGKLEIVGRQSRVVSEKTSLNFDEFVAAMWARGVRYGIDHQAVLDMIGQNRTGRIVIARPLAAKEGQDAALKEETDRLYRDNAPRQLSSGKVDLRHFRNRFPQIRKGEPLLRKVPRVPGTPGMDISGAVLEPKVPQDFDLEALSGPGTHVERNAKGEIIYSSMDGFLNIDLQTNRIAVEGKIVSYGGVSMKTTGDISLDGDHFEEHGEIQEKRVVEGKNITVHGDVYGKVVSSGGRIHLMQNLVGGSAINQEGDIEIGGFASSANLNAKTGCIQLARAENSLIVGDAVILEYAVNCTIAANRVEIGIAEGCAIAGKSIRVHQIGPRKDNQSTVSVVVPDLSSFDAEFSQMASRMAEIDSMLLEKQAKVKQITELQDVRNYLLVGGKLQRKEITLTDEQKAHWAKLGQKVAPLVKALSFLNAEVRSLSAEREGLVEKADLLEIEKEESARGICVSVGIATGETIVRKWMRPRDARPLVGMPERDLRVRLRDAGSPGDHLMSSSGRDLDWQFCLPS